VNAKIYVGVHKTKDLNDGYMGSGKVISAAIQKHGAENFKKDILEYFDTSEAMYAREKEVVTDEFLLREDTYNLRRGGHGGFDYINKQGLHYKGYSSAKERNRAITPFNGESGKEIRKKALIEYYKKEAWKKGIAAMQEFHKKNPSVILNNLKLAQTPQARIKRKEALLAIKHQQGSNNSQYGTMWITNGIENIKIRKEEIDKYLIRGYNKGRTVKKIKSRIG